MFIYYLNVCLLKEEMIIRYSQLVGSWKHFILLFFPFFFFVTAPWGMSEKAMATHSSTLACKIPRTEEPGRLQCMGSLRLGHDWATSLSLFTFMHWRRKWQPTPVFLPGESQARDGGAWRAAIYGVEQSWTRLKRLSSSSSSSSMKHAGS